MGRVVTDRISLSNGAQPEGIKSILKYTWKMYTKPYAELMQNCATSLVCNLFSTQLM